MNTDEWLFVVIGFFIGVVVCVKVVAFVVVTVGRIVMHWVMDQM